MPWQSLSNGWHVQPRDDGSVTMQHAADSTPEILLTPHDIALINNAQHASEQLRKNQSLTTRLANAGVPDIQRRQIVGIVARMAEDQGDPMLSVE